MSKVTIADIARAASVSKSTVSRVLNGTATVAPPKKRAVLEATQRLGFKPDVVARSLARGRSMTVGVLTQSIGSPFYDAISQGVIAGLNDTDYQPLFVDGQWQPEKERHGISTLLGRRVDGLVLIGGGLPGEEIEQLRDGVPTVFVARQVPGELHHCIWMDNVRGGFEATRHLLEQGHRRIAMVCGLAHHPDAADRLMGYRRALGEAGVAVDPALIVDGDFTAASGERAVDELLAGGIDFSAVFAANDMTAMGARLSLYRHGVRVPEDVSLVGFDDQLEAAVMTPPLTTIRQPAREMGEQAARAVLALIQGDALSTQPVTAKLIIRDSVARRRS